MTKKEIIKALSEEYGFSERDIEVMYRSWFAYMRSKTQAIVLKDTMTEKEVDNLRTNFIIPALGRLTLTYDRYCRVKKMLEYKRINAEKKRNNENKED